MRIKICGVTSLEDALAACECGADALGFNFAEEAKPKNRYIDPDAAYRIIKQLPPFVTTVAVTVNADKAQIERYMDIADYVQFHGEETPEFLELYGRRAIKAIRLAGPAELELLRKYESVSAILLDAAVDGMRGGTGVTCDWTLAAKAVKTSEVPIILAGGLTPDNVHDAITQVRPYAVDVAGGVESEPGKKDHERIRHLIERVRVS